MLYLPKTTQKELCKTELLVGFVVAVVLSFWFSMWTGFFHTAQQKAAKCYSGAPTEHELRVKDATSYTASPSLHHHQAFYIFCES